jgi:hypothetical protein
MPVPSQGHYGFHSFPVVDWFCLFIYLKCQTLTSHIDKTISLTFLLTPYLYTFSLYENPSFIIFSAETEYTISLEMPVPSQGHCGFHSFSVVDWFCLFINLWVLTFSLQDCSEFCNFVITLIDVCWHRYRLRTYISWTAYYNKLSMSKLRLCQQNNDAQMMSLIRQWLCDQNDVQMLFFL